ncbi:MAG: hypothetical protein ACT4N8_12900 [Sphingosinicella sp.]|uniref:hypothetical protein n=1 Tax=Sphingosinicella sp. TaxID=1917971 RepID=UPI0040380255
MSEDRDESITAREALHAAPGPRLQNPFYPGWRAFKDYEHEMRAFKVIAKREAPAICARIGGFAELEAYTGFHAFDEVKETLQFSFGHRPMRRFTLEGKPASENGASLVYSAGPTGHCMVALYPPQSDLGRVHEKLIFLRIGRISAARLRDRLARDLRDLVAYEMVGSLDTRPTLRQRLRVRWLRLVKYKQMDGGFTGVKTHRDITDIANALSGKAASSVFAGVMKLLGPLLVLAVLGYLGFSGLAARLAE